MLNPLPDDALRQYVDARSVFLALRAAQKAAQEVRGGMYWKKQGEVDYLIRTNTRNGQQSLGRRSTETEDIYTRFHARKQNLEARVDSLKQALTKHQRLNRALFVGRTPLIVIKILNLLADADLLQFFTVIGTHALYAYESAAGVRIESAGAMETRDVDFLWDMGKRVSFVTHLNRTQEKSIIKLLKKLDQSFTVDELAGGYKAQNKDAFEVDFIWARSLQNEPHPVRFSADEADFWPVVAKRTETLLSSPRFEAIVIATSGEMAMMPTIAPDTFCSFKHWMGVQADRDPVKRRRDQTQAQIIEQLIIEYLPQYLPNSADQSVK